MDIVINTEKQLKDLHAYICNERGIDVTKQASFKTSYQSNQARLRDIEERKALSGELDPTWTTNICG